MASSMDIDNVASEEKTTYTWTIGNFSSFVGVRRSEDFLRRKGLNVDLLLFPMKNHFYFPNHYSIYLGIRTDRDDEINVYCQISLLNQNFEKCNTKEGLAKIVNGMIQTNWQYTISRDYLESNGLLVGDQLKIYCEVHVLDNTIKLSATKPLEIAERKHSTIMQDLVNLFTSQKNSDVILVAGGKQFSAHKSILSSRSPVFAAMFEHECEEKKQNRVEMSDVDSETLFELLRYIYTDKCSSLDQYSADLMVYFRTILGPLAKLSQLTFVALKIYFEYSSQFDDEQIRMYENLPQVQLPSVKVLHLDLRSIETHLKFTQLNIPFIFSSVQVITLYFCGIVLPDDEKQKVYESLKVCFRLHHIFHRKLIVWKK